MIYSLLCLIPAAFALGYLLGFCQGVDDYRARPSHYEAAILRAELKTLDTETRM